MSQIVTIFSKSEFGMGINKYEGKLLNTGVKPYAQYNKAPFVEFIPKRKRKGVKIIKGYSPYLVVLEGKHPDLDPENPMQIISQTEDIVVRQSKYSSFDSRYESDFDKVLDAYIAVEQPKILLDARNSRGFSSY